MPVKAGFYTAAGLLAHIGLQRRPHLYGRRVPDRVLNLTHAPVFGVMFGRVVTMTFGLALTVLGLTTSSPAGAVDGCKVLLCMAGNWRQIAPCQPEVRQALRDVARGRAWPQCGVGGNSGSANQWVPAVSCPEQYRTEGLDHWDRVVYTCPFSGVVHVAVAGQPWSRTWWSTDGDAVVEWLPAARAAFADQPGTMDTRFDDDHAAWVISERIRRAAEPPSLNPGA